MFKNKFQIIIILLLSMLCSCVKNKKEIIAERVIIINPYEATNEINLSLFVDTIEYIKLQTDSSFTLGNAGGIYIMDKHIYVADFKQEAVLIFDDKGKYIDKFSKQGQGPGEYLFFEPIIIDDDEEYIGMVTRTSSGHEFIKYSSISFDLIEKYAMPEIWSKRFFKNDDFFYFATQQMFNTLGESETISGLVIVENNEFARVLFDRKIARPNHYHYFSPYVQSFAYNDRGELFISIMYEDTFYQLEGLEATPAISIDFGKHGINNIIAYKPLEYQHRYLKRVNGRAAFPALRVNNSNILFVSYYFKKNSSADFFRDDDLRHYIELPKSRMTFHTKMIRNDITNFPSVILGSSYNREFIDFTPWYKNYLVDVIIPSEVIPKDKSGVYVEGLGEITIDDNPIILLMRLKENI